MSAAMQQKQYKVHGIELITFSIQAQQGRDFNKIPLEYNVKQEQKTNPGKELVLVFTSITIRETGNDLALANLEVACGFELQNFETILKQEEAGNYIIPHELNIAINRISIAICRGILYSQLRGSYLQNMNMPLLPIG